MDEDNDTLHWHALNYRTASVQNAHAMFEALENFVAQRTWVGLTKEERHEISMANKPYVADIMAAHEEELKRRNT